MDRKYKIDFATGLASCEQLIGGVPTKINFSIFTDSTGLKIFTKNGVEYLTEKNSEVL